MKRLLGTCIVIVAFWVSGCENTAQDHRLDLIGYWVVEKAFRDKKETPLLEGVFFKFDEPRILLTNLPNTSDLPTTFECKNNKVIQNLAVPIEYTIQKIDQASLVLAFEMNNTPFELHLKKTEPPLMETAVDSLPPTQE
ncbi:MAG: hypothetical protein JNJ57_01205 [Saprospiraceae bacterium]|nr:hypothetical protein [Saprospiraceae bacterium]